MDIHSELPRIMGFYDFGHTPTIHAGPGADQELIRSTQVHECAHKDDTFNTIFGRMLRTLMARAKETDSAEDLEILHRSLEGAWNVFEGSATFQQLCLELLSEEPDLFNLTNKLPGRYKTALFLFNRAIEKIFKPRAQGPFDHIVELYMIHCVCGAALAEFILDLPIYDQRLSITDFPQLLAAYQQAESADSILFRLANWEDAPMAIPRLGIDLHLLTTQEGMRLRRSYIEALKSSLGAYLFGTQESSLTDRAMLDFASEIGLVESTVEEDAREVAETAYILRYENTASNLPFKTDIPVVDFGALLTFISGVPEEHSLVTVLGQKTGETAYICVAEFDTRTWEITNGAMYESQVTAPEFAQIAALTDKNSVIIMPPLMVTSDFADWRQMLDSQASWIIPVADFSPQLLVNTLDAVAGDRPRAAIRLEVSDAVEIVAINAGSLHWAFAGVKGDIDAYAGRLGVSAVSDDLTILQWLGLSHVHSLLASNKV